jgi:flagellar hook-length control protein FliK
VSHLTVSYVSQTPAGTAPAGLPAAAAPAADSPLGFLAALVDQLLAGGAEAVKTEIAAKTGATVDVPGLLNFAVDASAGTTAATPQPADLFAALGVELDKLATQLNAGDTPSSIQLQDLRSAITTLSDALDAAPATPVAVSAPIEVSAEISRTATPAITDDQIAQLLTSLGLIEPPQTKPADTAVVAQVDTPDPVANLVDRLVALSQTLAATAPDLSQKLEALAAKIEAKPEVAVQLGLVAPQPDTDAVTIAHIIRTLLGHETKGTDPTGPKPPSEASAAPATNDDLLKILATLGISAPATAAAAPTDTSVGTTANVAPTTTVPTPLVRLSTQLSTVATELAATSPELAKKLEAVATKLVSADADPDLLGKLTSAAAQPSGTALDKLVSSLIDPKPAPIVTAPAAPQIAAPAELTLPAPIAPKQPKSAVTEVKAAPPEPISVTADSAQPAPRLAITAVSRESASHATEPKIEAKVAAVVAEAATSDATSQPTQPQQPAPQPVQQARVLPAAYQPVANPINMGQVAFEMVRQVQQGSSRFTIRLDPPELGRVDVKMHVDNTGAVNARLTVDRAETLDLFQRDRQSLERALSQAGLDAGKTNLEFSLRQNNHNPFAGMMGGDQRQQQPGYGAPSRFSNESEDIAAMPAVTLYRGTASAAGVNIFA